MPGVELNWADLNLPPVNLWNCPKCDQSHKNNFDKLGDRAIIITELNQTGERNEKSVIQDNNRRQNPNP